MVEDQKIDETVKPAKLMGVMKLPNVNFTKYRGFAETSIFGLMYLLRRNKHECVILTNLKPLS